MKRSPLKGQLLLIGLILLALLTASIPLLLTISSRLAKRFIDRTSDERISNVARAAFAQISYVFESQPEAWNRAMAGDPLKDLGFNGDRSFSGLQGTPYTVLCGRDPTLFPDQLKVTVNVFVRDRMSQKTRLFQAILSHRTLGADLPDLAHAPAALYVLGDINLAWSGLTPPELDVQWGSIVCFGTLTLSSEPNGPALGHHPRKYCRVGYQPLYRVDPKTDQREYWVSFPMGAPVEIDDQKYLQLAREQTVVDGPRFGQGSSGGYVELPDQTVVFRTAAPLDDELATPVFYVDGSVRFESEGIDLKNGAMIIGHNAVFEGHSAGMPMELHVPSHADREYPYLLPENTFPCESKLGASCPSPEALGDDGLIDFRGFLYVKGDLYVNQDTVIVGVVRVDGTVRIASGKRLTIFFDDRISHAILLKGAVLEQQIVSQPLL